MIKVYVLPNCPRCEELKKYMRKKNISFLELNVEENATALAKMTMEGIDKFPVVEMGGRIYAEDVSFLKRIVSGG